MPNQETVEDGKVERLISDGLSLLHDSTDKRISDLAFITHRRLEKRELVITLDDKIDPRDKIPTSDYGIFVDRTQNNEFLNEGLLVNPSWLIGKNGSSARLIAGDLLRTIHIADQARSRLYTRRFRDIYGEALEVQKKWLEDNDVPPIVNDPRNGQEEALLGVLGRARYYSDIGYDGWFKTLIEAGRPNNYGGDYVDFVVNRQGFIPIIHPKLVAAYGQNYTTLMTQEQRTAAVGKQMLNILIGKESEKPRGIFVVK